MELRPGDKAHARTVMALDWRPTLQDPAFEMAAATSSLKFQLGHLIMQASAPMTSSLGKSCVSTMSLPEAVFTGTEMVTNDVMNPPFARITVVLSPSVSFQWRGSGADEARPTMSGGCRSSHSTFAPSPAQIVGVALFQLGAWCLPLPLGCCCFSSFYRCAQNPQGISTISFGASTGGCHRNGRCQPAPTMAWLDFDNSISEALLMWYQEEPHSLESNPVTFRDGTNRPTSETQCQGFGHRHVHASACCSHRPSASLSGS